MANNKINVNTAENNVIMSGTNNLIDANSLYSVIGSGIDNQVLNNYSVIGSGNSNKITVLYAFTYNLVFFIKIVVKTYIREVSNSIYKKKKAVI